MKAPAIEGRPIEVENEAVSIMSFRGAAVKRSVLVGPPGGVSEKRPPTTPSSLMANTETEAPGWAPGKWTGRSTTTVGAKPKVPMQILWEPQLNATLPLLLIVGLGIPGWSLISSISANV